MRVLVDGLETGVIEGEVVDGEPLDTLDMCFDLDGRFTVQCDDGSRVVVDGLLVEIEILASGPKRIM